MMQLLLLLTIIRQAILVSAMCSSPLLVAAVVLPNRISKALAWSCHQPKFFFTQTMVASHCVGSSSSRCWRSGDIRLSRRQSTSFQRLSTPSLLLLPVQRQPENHVSSSPPYTTSNSPNEKERQMHQDAREILLAGIAAVDPTVALDACVRVVPPSTLAVQNRLFYDAKDFDHVSIISFGKASVPMAFQVCEMVYQAFLSNSSSSSSSTGSMTMDGLVITKDLHCTEEERRTLHSRYNVHVRTAGHPVPDERSVQAATEVMELVTRRRGNRTLFLCCISGGGSALLTLPIGTLTLKDIQITSQYMLQSGMPIQRMNVIRKRLDGIKGGRLAAAAYPSTMCTFVLSDVIGDPLTSIASGPTVPDDDDQTLLEARHILKEYGIINNLPHHIYQLFHGTQQPNGNHQQQQQQQQQQQHILETPKSNHPMFQSQKCNTILVGNNQAAVLASATTAEQLGYSSVVLGTCIEGEAKEVANVYAAMASYHLSVRQHHHHYHRENDTNTTSTSTTTTTMTTTTTTSEQQQQQQQQQSTSQYYLIRNQFPVALIAGGETTVTISHGTNIGRGGRNQELGLAVALILQQKKLRNIVFATVGTDGTDGPTDAAGVVVDGGTIARIEHQQCQQQQQQHHHHNAPPLLTGTQALHDHDSYTFFSYEHVNDVTSNYNNYPALIKTGPTGTNVADIAVILIN